MAPVSRALRDELRRFVAEGDYQRHEIDYPDTPFENREDPTRHLFRTAVQAPRVEIWGKRR